MAQALLTHRPEAIRHRFADPIASPSALAPLGAERGTSQRQGASSQHSSLPPRDAHAQGRLGQSALEGETGEGVLTFTLPSERGAPGFALAAAQLAGQASHDAWMVVLTAADPLLLLAAVAPLLGSQAASLSELRERLLPALQERLSQRPEAQLGEATPTFHTDNPLSARERAVLRLVAEGWSNKQIARELALAERTVKVHLTGAMNKLGAENRAHAAVLAIRRHLL